jgi:molybdopterin converting factor small subunit
MKVKFIGGIRYLIGIKELEVEFGSLDEIFNSISEKLGKNINYILDKENNKSFVILNENGKEIKFSVVIHNNGENILKKEKLEDGDLSIIIPVGGG